MKWNGNASITFQVLNSRDQIKVPYRALLRKWKWRIDIHLTHNYTKVVQELTTIIVFIRKELKNRNMEMNCTRNIIMWETFQTVKSKYPKFLSKMCLYNNTAEMKCTENTTVRDMSRAVNIQKFCQRKHWKGGWNIFT